MLDVMRPVSFSNGVGLLTLCKREIVRFLVVAHQTLFPPLISSLLFLFIFGLSVGKEINFTDLNMPYLTYIVPGILTMHLISASFENTSSSLFISRWHNHIQEVLLSPLSYMEMVIGLVTGGVARGILVACGVYLIASLMTDIQLANPLLALFFMFTISVLFSCCGIMAALWAKDFGQLSIWGTYVITPLVFLGGVFNPLSMLPAKLQGIALCNPMFYLVNGVRYSILGVADAPLSVSILLSLGASLAAFLLTVHLFRVGYRLRT